MATYSWNSNVVPSDPAQYFTLNVTFEDGIFRWSVVAQSNGHDNTRNNIYGLNVSIGGVNYYRGDIAWQNYSPWTVVYSGTTSLANCTIIDGTVRFVLSGNYYYGTWNSTYTCRINQAIAITPPNVSWPATPYTITKPFNTDTIVSNISSLNFSFNASPGTIDEDNPHTITAYKLYIDDIQVYSGPDNHCTILAPATSGTHIIYFTATESNGALGRSTDLTFNSEAYIYPSFISVESIRWSNGDGTGQELDDGEYGRMSATFNNGSVSNSSDPDNPVAVQAKCDISVSSFSGTINVSGGVLYTSSNILSPDYSYTVTYKLYDDFIGLDNAIIRSDTISIGLRGVEIVYDDNDGYGVGIAKKGEPGYTDTALPLRVVSVNPSGSIISSATITPEPIYLVDSGAVTRSSGKTIASEDIAIWGRIVHLDLILNGDSTYYNVGDNIFVGTLASEYRPKTNIMNSGYWGSAVYVGWIKPNGEIIIRLSGYSAGYTMNSNSVMTWVYII